MWSCFCCSVSVFFYIYNLPVGQGWVGCSYTKTWTEGQNFIIEFGTLILTILYTKILNWFSFSQQKFKKILYTKTQNFIKAFATNLIIFTIQENFIFPSIKICENLVANPIVKQLSIFIFANMLHIFYKIYRIVKLVVKPYINVIVFRKYF